MELTPEAARHFRDKLRSARAAALQDAEGFLEIVVVVEALGAYLNPKRIPPTLGQVRPEVEALAARGPLAQAVSTPPWRVHAPLKVIYQLVRDGRNSAVHTGAYARHLTGKCIELALILEDSLTMSMATIGDFMVAGVTVAAAWHPVSFVRQTMLSNAYSFLPVWTRSSGREGWWLVSDFDLATYLRSGKTSDARHELLSQSLESAVRAGSLRLQQPLIAKPEMAVNEVLASSRGLPVLVCGKNEPDLLGIATPYDLL